MAKNTVYRIDGPDPEVKRRQEAEEVALYGRVQTDAERATNRRVAAARAEQDARVEAERRAYLREQLYMSGETTRARLMSDLNPLRVAGETYAGELAVAGAGRALRTAFSTNMRPGYIRIGRGGTSKAAREAAALRHGRVMAGREAATSRAAQFKEIRRAAGVVERDTAKSATARAAESAYEYAPGYSFGETPTIYDPSIAPFIMDAAETAARVGKEVGKEAGREFANRAMARAVNATADAVPGRAAQIAERFGPGTYRRAMQGPGVDWSHTFYSGLVDRTADAVSRGLAILKDAPVSELATKAAKGAVKNLSAPRLVHAIGTKVPGIRWVTDKALPTMAPGTRDAVLNTLTAVQDVGLGAAWATGRLRASSEQKRTAESRKADEQLGYLRSGYDFYSTNSVYGTGRDVDMDAASWAHAASQLLADRAAALNYVDGKGGIILPGRQSVNGEPSYQAHGQGDVERLFDSHIDAMASLPAAQAAKDRNRATLFGILSNGASTYADAKALAADEAADKASRDRAKAAVERADRIFDSWTPSEQAFTDMDEFAREYLGGGVR